MKIGDAFKLFKIQKIEVKIYSCYNIINFIERVIFMNKNILKDENFLKLEQKLKIDKNILLFLDYDGTLSHFKKNPKTAYPIKGVKNIIKKISESKFINITVISGRNLEDLKEKIKLNNINYAGLHGLEMKDYNPKNLNQNEIKYYINMIKEKYKEKINKDQLYLEDKKFVLSIHYRNNFKEVKKLKNFINNLVDKKQFEVMEGRKIIEIRPKGWDKGKAVKMIRKKSFINQSPFEIYIGDDTTDEDAFSVINGFSIYVKNEKEMSKQADFFLNSPDEVYKFLNKFNNTLKNLR